MDDENNSLKELVLQRLNQIRLDPVLGQHFLVDQSVLDLLVKNVTLGNVVIEVGPGVGQMTESLATKASKVIAIEIDKRYKPILDIISQKRHNIEVLIQDALTLNWKDIIRNYSKKNKIQIVSNLPYHISEPFLHKIIGLPIQNVILLVGKKLGYVIQAKNGDANFGLRSLLVQTFYKTEILSQVSKNSFFPVPGTDAMMIKLTPRSVEEIKTNKHDFIFRRLFLTSHYSPLVKNCIKEALIELDNNKALTQNQARKIIESLELSDKITDKSFEQLNNAQLRFLSSALRSL